MSEIVDREAALRDRLRALTPARVDSAAPA